MTFDRIPSPLEPSPPVGPSGAAPCRAHLEPQAMPHDPFCAAVLRAIEAGMVAGQLSQALVARQFGLTPRTLQRRCRERGLHYRDLVTDARRTAALRLLRDRSLTIHDVAVALGYDASSFNRVFRGWTGLSPSIYRRRAVTTPAAVAHDRGGDAARDARDCGDLRVASSGAG